MKNTKHNKGIKLDGTLKKITVPNRRGVSWDSMLEPHYEEIRLARLRREKIKKIAAKLCCATSTLSSFIKTRSDRTRPYMLPPRAGSVAATFVLADTNKTASTAPISMPPVKAIIPPANYVSPVKTSPAAGKTKKGKLFSFPPGTLLTVKTT